MYASGFSVDPNPGAALDLGLSFDAHLGFEVQN